MTGRGQTEKLGWPRWQQMLLIALLAIIAVNRLTMLVEDVAMRAGLYGQLPWTGAYTIIDPQAEPGYLKVIQVDPGSPMARAGVREGDYVATHPSYDQLRWWNVGEQIAMTLDHQGTRSQINVVVEPLPMTDAARQRNTQFMLNLLAVAVSMLIGCFILWRGWGNKTAMLLGAALVGIGIGGYGLPHWASAPWLAIPMYSLTTFGFFMGALLTIFAMRMYEETVGPLPRWHWRMAKWWLILIAGLFVLITRDVVGVYNSLAWMGGPAKGALIAYFGSVLMLAYLAAAWYRSEAAARNRLMLIFLSLLAITIGGLVTSWSMAQTGSFLAADWLGYVNALMMGLIAPGALAYAVLRHKLFDLGFAVNRTLVFATISAILLVSFGTLEWAVDHLVPEAWHEGSAFYSAGIAVGLFLLFHRIRDFVEHGIERLFFHGWHLNEAALKRFVTTAAHVEKPEALAGQFARELARFTGGAAAALYTRSPEGSYASATGATIDADDPALAAMRAEQGQVVPAEVGSNLTAALALPMMHQAALAGFVLLGPKPTGEDFRPDEIEVLSWATQQVGLDLQAIRVRDLELTNLKLVERNRTLSEILTSTALAKA